MQRHEPGNDQVDHYQLFKDYLVYVSSDHMAEQGSEYQRALAAMKSANHERADELLEPLYRADSENIWYALAYTENLELLERNAEAEVVFRKLLDIFPGDYVISLRLLTLLNRLGRHEEALEIARELEVGYPTEQRVYFALSDIYEALGETALQLMAEAEYHTLNANITQAVRLYDQVLALPASIRQPCRKRRKNACSCSNAALRDQWNLFAGYSPAFRSRRVSGRIRCGFFQDKHQVNINFQALGCRLNEAELETWASEFMQRGHQVTTDAAEADVVVFNSCAVTAQADRKSRQQISRLQRHNPAARLVVTGCHASLNPEAVKTGLGVDLVVDNRQKDELVEQALQLLGDDAAVADDAASREVQNTLLLRGRHRGFVKIQDGCRYRCTYCIVTIARGDERSRSETDILADIDRLHRQGVQEVALTGVHVGGYGSDIDSSLYRLLNRILEATEIPRLRLASVEPWDLPAHFFTLFENPRLMPHMHLPIQSGCDSVLRRMARRCKTAEFARLVDRARSAVPGFNVTTDLITGFPGETEQEWRQTLDFVAATGFGHIHIFPFSARAGTKAARLPDQVDMAVRKARSREMHELAAGLKRQALSEQLGDRVDVLWEQQINADTGQWIGYSPNYHKVLSDRSRDPRVDDQPGQPRCPVRGRRHAGQSPRAGTGRPGRTRSLRWPVPPTATAAYVSATTSTGSFRPRISSTTTGSSNRVSRRRSAVAAAAVVSKLPAGARCCGAIIAAARRAGFSAINTCGRGSSGRAPGASGKFSSARARPGCPYRNRSRPASVETACFIARRWSPAFSTTPR